MYWNIGKRGEIMKKVLLTSASKPFLKRNTSLLMSQELQFFTSSSGLEALKLHEEHNFDLILCDLELDDMDGCGFCSEVHKMQMSHLVPVILICYDSAESIARVKKSAASAILLRPINPTHLLVTIGSFLDMQLARKKRIVLHVPVLNKTQGFEFLSNSRDVSITGILLETEFEIKIGSQITCHFHLPDIGQIEPKGEVIRSFISNKGKKLYGVKFIELPVATRRAIERYVDKNNHLGVKQKPYRPLEMSMQY